MARSTSCFHRDPHEHGRAVSDTRLDLHLSAHQRHAFAHTHEPEPTAVSGAVQRTVCVEADTVVLDDRA
jgi:hypothetical protein